MRDTDFAINTRDDGEMAFRTLLPLEPTCCGTSSPPPTGRWAACMKLYREWQLSGDEAFLRQLWPQAKRALEYAVGSGWDAGPATA